MAHYYSNSPDSEHNRKEHPVKLKGQNFRFITDAGVFSKTQIDFGSKLLIETFDTTDLPDGPLLDVGCGYGPIGIALADTTGRNVTMVDINERAVELAKENAALNHVETVTIFPSNLYDKVEGKYAAVISNPPIRAGKKVVHEILEKAYDFLEDNGTLTIVIQKKQGAPSAKEKMNTVFGNVQILAKDKGYYILQSKRQKNV